MANSKGRFQTWISPLACSFNRFLDWDFSVGISAIQRDHAKEEGEGKRLYGCGVITNRSTAQECTTRYSYEAGDTVHGKVDATRLQQEQELRDIIQKARYNPWHVFHHGLLHCKDSSGNKMYAPYGVALVKTTPFSSLPADTRKLLGFEYNCASWPSHPLSGYGVHFFLKGFELGKMQGNMLVELNLKGKAYSEGYKSPLDKREGNDVTTLLQELSHAQHREFAPSYDDVGFRVPDDSDPRSKKPKQDDPDYAAKLMLYEAFCYERDVWAELKAVRANFSTVVSAVSQAYGQDCLQLGRALECVSGPCSAGQTVEKDGYRAREIDELYMRPFDDIVVEEFISNLPGPTIREVDEPMEPASGPAKAPAYSPSGEMAGDKKQEPDSSAPMETDAPEGSSFEEGSGVKVEKAEQTTFELPDLNFSADASNDQDNLYEQGIRGKTKTRVEPGAYEAEAKATAEAEAKNEQAFEDFAGEKQEEGLTDTVDYQNFIEVYHLRERMSPRMKLAEQIHGYGLEDLMEQVCTMEPICYRRSTKLDVVFRAGDYRSTLDDREMARASAAREEALELNHMLLERFRELNKGRRSASREELMNAMLHYFLAAGVDDDELGDLSLERMPKPIGPAEEGPVPSYNSRTKYTALVLNLGSFARNRKRSAPSLYSDIIDYDDSGESVGLLIKSIAHAKAHLFLLCEAGELNATVLDFLHRRGWETLRNPNGELLIGCRTNGQGSKMTMLAGPEGSLTAPLTRVSLPHEALASMCLHYQDALGQPYRDCPKIDWNTFPGLDPMVATVLEWGHSLTDDQWAVLPADQKEFKLNVSEWLLNSTSANDLLNDRDHDSHTQGQVLALVLQPLVHNVLLNLLILQVERPLAKEENCDSGTCNEPPVYLPGGFSMEMFAVSFVNKAMVK
ncbi:hypothetical protein AK812_SmicGene35407 [Symbiodinium microadriaticum]|uniref:Uncharacterized protein n=1 Tax=Symbiodinium microadriaticum TaxID=2951 RepID=A0A1Q9CLI7_SYMMI|nr:hypothetical protein AK812_SmicGene35407 [Symbiodinium microadriaticum]